MNFAINYSQAASELFQEHKIQIDRFKCPAWPDLLAKVLPQYPVYVHCPLRVGMGIGNAMDTETRQSADWDKYEAILAQTDTPWISVHLGPKPEDHPGIPIESLTTEHAERVAEVLIRDVSAVVARFGAEHVVGENIFGYYKGHLWAAMLPEVIERVIEETGCGFLLDLSHARLAARDLRMDPKTYINRLPMNHIREIHVTGIQHFSGRWLEMARHGGVDTDTLRYTNHLIDHLPMVDEDWNYFAWAMAQIHQGLWAEPWVVASEYGGVGWVFEAVTEKHILEDQTPRLYELVKNHQRESK